MKTYALGSSPLVGAPGVVAWAVNGYLFEDDRPALLNVIVKTWRIPEHDAQLLLSGQVPYRVEDEVVLFEVPDLVEAGS